MSTKKKEIEITISEADRKRLWNVMMTMLKSCKRMKESEKLIEAVICYQTYKFKLYLAEALTWDSYKKSMGYTNKATVDRYFAAAKAVTEWAMEAHPPKGDELFIVNEFMVSEFVSERQAKGLGTDFKSIIEDRKQHKLFLKYLEGEETMTFDEFKKAMTIKRRTSQDASPVIPEQNREVKFDEASGIIHLPNPKRPEENLFSSHERIIKAGFVWNRETGKYENPDGTLASRSQIGEYIDHQSGLKIYEEATLALNEAIEVIVSTKKHYEELHFAFKAKHQSPNDVQLIQEKRKELEQKLYGLTFEVSLLGKDTEE